MRIVIEQVLVLRTVEITGVVGLIFQIWLAGALVLCHFANTPRVTLK
jgi:hypothetical protein